MQISEQIVNLLLGQYLRETFHFVSTDANDLADAGVIGRHSAGRKVLPLE
jgi:hypothetical protein